MQHCNLRHLTNTDLANLCGMMDENIKQIANYFLVTISRHDAKFTISGVRSLDAHNALVHFSKLCHKHELSLEEIQLGLISLNQKEIANNSKIYTRKGEIKGRTINQASYLQAIFDNDITFGIGPAGTGKTYLAVAQAINHLERDIIKRIILVRPAVEAGERLGFLPGDLSQKVDPYLRPLYDALYDLLGFEKVNRLFEKQLIEIAPLAFMRGRTLNNAFIILDEAQNTTPEQMKMFLTRIGFGSKAVVTGNLTQCDLEHRQISGLSQVAKILTNIPGLHFHNFTKEDVVRHPLVQKIVSAYEEYTPTNKN